jgi:hypothetical protein
MQLFSGLTVLLSLTSLGSAAILRREPKGASGGGGGHGGSSGGHSGGSSGGHSGSPGRGGSGDTGHPAVSYSSISTESRSANYFGGGGGRPFILSDASVFHGRQMGGGARTDVPGTRAFGSGYPYSVGDIKRTGIAGQPFPFGFWPIYWRGRGHSDEYGVNSTVAAQRPGGDQVLVQLVPNVTSSAWNTTAINGINETYWMIGDTQSVATLLSILVGNNTTDQYGCGVQNLTIQPFNSSNPQEPVQFENVIQWYRSSSFALAYTGYNNSYDFPPLNETAGLGWNDSTPLPVQLQYSPFLNCINTTISAALPIIDSDSTSPALSGGDIAGIVVCALLLAVIIGFCVTPCIFAVKQGISDAKRERERKLLVEKLTVKGTPTLVVSESPSRPTAKKMPPSPWFPPSSDSLKPPFYSQRSSYASTTLPEPAFTKSGHESFYSSRTLIAEHSS